MNKVILVGRLTKDPELKYTPSGIAVARFTVAINRPPRSKDSADAGSVNPGGQENSAGTQNQEADFIRVVAWRRLGEICSEYLSKGRLVYIEGRLTIDSYEKDGIKRWTSEVIADQMQMLERKGTMSPAAVTADAVNA